MGIRGYNFFMKHLIICIALLTALLDDVKAEVIELKPLQADAVITSKANNESQLFDLDPKRRQVVITPNGVYLIEKQSVKAGIFGSKCRGK